jgi:hypothetical protein
MLYLEPVTKQVMTSPSGGGRDATQPDANYSLTCYNPMQSRWRRTPGSVFRIRRQRADFRENRPVRDSINLVAARAAKRISPCRMDGFLPIVAGPVVGSP